MPVRFDHGKIKRLLKYFNMKPSRKGSNLYEGFGKDGKWRRCKFDYHKDRDMVKTGTAKVIASSLGFKTCLEMKEFISKDM